MRKVLIFLITAALASPAVAGFKRASEEAPSPAPVNSVPATKPAPGVKPAQAPPIKPVPVATPTAAKLPAQPAPERLNQARIEALVSDWLAGLVGRDHRQGGDSWTEDAILDPRAHAHAMEIFRGLERRGLVRAEPHGSHKIRYIPTRPIPMVAVEMQGVEWEPLGKDGTAATVQVEVARKLVEPDLAALVQVRSENRRTTASLRLINGRPDWTIGQVRSLPLRDKTDQPTHGRALPPAPAPAESAAAKPLPQPVSARPGNKTCDSGGLNFLLKTMCNIEGPERFWKCVPDGRNWNTAIPGCDVDGRKS